MASNNLLAWDPPLSNALNDTDYAANEQRQQGAVDPSVFPSATANKLLHQATIFGAAFGDMLVARANATVSDASQSALASALAVVALQSDIAVETTRAEAAESTLQTHINNETTRAEAAENAINNPTQSKGVNGYVTLPGGIILQWMTGTQDSASGVVTQSGTWPIPFPTAVLAATVSTNWISDATDTDIHIYQMTSVSASGWSVRRGQGGVYTSTQVSTPTLFAVGY